LGLPAVFACFTAHPFLWSLPLRLPFIIAYFKNTLKSTLQRRGMKQIGQHKKAVCSKPAKTPGAGLP
jgi:hypothetical protein